MDIADRLRLFPSLSRARPRDAHKNSCGTVAVFGGAPGMSGAPVLAASAALFLGCGKVFAGFFQAALPMPYIPERPEIMLRTAEDLRRQKNWDVAVVGCGLGLSAGAARLVEFLAFSPRPQVLDADALTILGGFARADCAFGLPENLMRVMTPHEGEAARLLDVGADEIHAHRERSARQIARKYGAWTVLKGPHSLIASPAGELFVNDTGNPNLATAGSGDVLAGIIASLLAQGIPVSEAVRAGVWLHGAAADMLMQRGLHVGLCASELLPEARRLRNAFLA